MIGWCAIGSLLIVSGAFIGGVGATRTGREFVRSLPHQVGSWLRVRRDRLAARLRQVAPWVKARYRRIRDRARTALDRLLVKLHVKRSVTVRLAGAAVGVSAMSGSVTVSPAPIERRVEALEEWRRNVDEDRHVAARFLLIGFSLILAGELIRLLMC